MMKITEFLMIYFSTGDVAPFYRTCHNSCNVAIQDRSRHIINSISDGAWRSVRLEPAVGRICFPPIYRAWVRGTPAGHCVWFHFNVHWVSQPDESILRKLNSHTTVSSSWISFNPFFCSCRRFFTLSSRLARSPRVNNFSGKWRIRNSISTRLKP